MALYVPEQELGRNVFLRGVSNAEVFIQDNDGEEVTLHVLSF